jgi:DNA replication protein DnaC
MERHEILDLMSELKLTGMRAAFDDILATGVKRQHPVQQIVADLLNAEIAEKHARSIKYQLTIARMPLAKEIEDFDFEGAPINETLAREIATGAFLAEQRNAVFVGGTGRQNAPGHRHRPCLHSRRRARAFLHRGRSRQQTRG